MSGKAAAGLLRWLCDAAERRYGIARAEALEAALLDQEDLADPSALFPAQTLADLLRFLLARTGDPGLGLQLAGPLDLRTQGFWGYALLSSLTLRQQIQLFVRYHALRAPLRCQLQEEAGLVNLEFQVLDMPPELEPLLLDWGLVAGMHLIRAQLSRSPELRIWLTYAERPHHAALRALAGAAIVFDAACNRIQVRASDLEVQLSGDPHLEKLAREQLDHQLAAQAEQARRAPDLLAAVRARLAARLHADASLPRVARDLRLGARTLQRQLENLGASFHELLDEARRTQAVACLTDTDEAIERIAVRLGYGDPSNFRRAFRRWTGVSPAAYRAQQRGAARSSADARRRPAPTGISHDAKPAR